MKTLLIIVAVAACFSVYAAADSRGGAWTAEVDGDSLQMTMFRASRNNEEGYRNYGNFGNVMGFNEALTAFTGLSATDAKSTAANVDFELRRPAGTIAFIGRFSDGTGAGHFKFTPSETFVREMDTLGYRGFTDDQMLVFAAHDFSPQTIRDLRAMGYQPTQREVEEIAIFRVTAGLARDYARAGYANLTLREIVDLRVGRVDAAYIAAMRDLGYKDLSARQLGEMAIIGVRPSYVRELQTVGLQSLSTRELTDLRIGHITAERIEAYRKLGYTSLSVRELSDFGIHGVTPKCIEELRSLGYDKLSPRQLIDMRIFGVTPDYIRKMNSMGYKSVPVEKLMKLKMSGLLR